MKSVNYTTSQQLVCAECNGLVIVCVDPDLTQLICTAEQPFLEGQIIGTSEGFTNCGCVVYTYTVAYDEAQLSDPTYSLLTSDIKGLFCLGCLTDWIQAKIGNEITVVDNGNGTMTLTTQHGCTYTIGAPPVT